MGRKNPIKRLICNSNKDIESEIVALTYYLNGFSREIILKIDVNDKNALAIANVPYYIDGNVLRKICSDSLEASLTDFQFITSTSSNCDLKSGYRSGRLFFNTIQDRRRAFEKAKLMKKDGRVVKLEKLGVKLPAWHNLSGKTLKRKYHQTGEDVIDGVSPESKKTFKNDEGKDNGWTMVTDKHKFSFRGKINRIVKDLK